MIVALTVITCLALCALIAQSWLIIRERAQQQTERDRWLNAIVAAQAGDTPRQFANLQMVENSPVMPDPVSVPEDPPFDGLTGA